MKARTNPMFAALLACGATYGFACGGNTPPAENIETTSPKPTAEPTVSATASATASAAPVASAAPEKPKDPPAPTPALAFQGEYSTPESVLVRDDGHVLVANINGKPLDKDNNGYISDWSDSGCPNALTPAIPCKTKPVPTAQKFAKWIQGGVNKVTLNAPKGMAIAKGVLYVSDIDVVRMFDAKSGAPKGEIKIDGATFLNDVAAGPDGKVYVSDSGFKAGEKGFEPTGSDAVYIIEKGKATALAKSKDLGGPNGLAVTDKGVWVNTFGSGEVYRLDAKGQKLDTMKPPKGGLDGIYVTGDTILVSSWEGSAVYRGKVGGTFETVLAGVKAPADFAFDPKTSMIVIPWFMDGKVEAYAVK